MNKQICPKCEGEKQTFRRINRGADGCQSDYFPCQFCDGRGEVENKRG